MRVVATAEKPPEETPAPGEESPETPAEGDGEPDEGAAPAAPPETPPEPEGVNPEAFEKEQRRHEREMRKILGGAFGEMSPCDTCGGVGFTPDSFEPVPPLLPDDSLVRCPTCNGRGVRSTPSFAPNYEETTCTACQGRGYQDKGVLEATAAQRAYEAQAAAYTEQPPPPVWNPVAQRYEVNGVPMIAYPSADALPSPTA